jgi:hypothetical protein
VKDAKTVSVAAVEARRALDPATPGDRALVIAWAAEEPHRIGEIALFPGRGAPQILGRGEGDGEGEEESVTKDEPRVRFFRQRPGQLVDAPPLSGPAISRRQLAICPRASGLEVERLGRCALSVNGALVDKAKVDVGDTVTLRGQLVLLCTRRAPAIVGLSHFRMSDAPRFGEADALSILGESPLAWQLRDQLAFSAGSGKHVLVHGASGTGKELAARAIHHLSPHAAGPFVARNAATLPPGLIDAELFGNAKNYPNHGMPERPGLIGQANGGTLFLDELAELPAELQAHLLRVLDAGGEYQRLGDATTRRSDFLLVGATNRPLTAIKHDLLARLTLRIDLPPLDARREDVPLLARNLLLQAAKTSPSAARFLRPGADGRLEPLLDPDLVEALLRRNYETHVRELDALLWRAMATSTGDTIVLPDELRVGPRQEPTEEQIRATLARAKGNVRRAAHELGLSSRYGLYRLMKKHGIAVDPESEPEET